MIQKKPRYTEEFKRAVAEAVQKGGKVRDVARAHGISVCSVHNWTKKFAEGGPGTKSPIKRRRQFSDEEKEKAVALVESGKSTTEVAELVGASTRAIYDWMLQLRPEQYRADQIAGRAQAALAEKRMREAAEQQVEAERRLEEKHAEELRAVAQEAERVKQMLEHPLKWMWEFTKTKDSHWREAGADS